MPPAAQVSLPDKHQTIPFGNKTYFSPEGARAVQPLGNKSFGSLPPVAEQKAQERNDFNDTFSRDQTYI